MVLRLGGTQGLPQALQTSRWMKLSAGEGSHQLLFVMSSGNGGILSQCCTDYNSANMSRMRCCLSCRLSSSEYWAERNTDLIHTITQQERWAGIYEKAPTDDKASGGLLGLAINCGCAALYMVGTCLLLLFLARNTGVARLMSAWTTACVNMFCWFIGLHGTASGMNMFRWFIP